MNNILWRKKYFSIKFNVKNKSQESDLCYRCCAVPLQYALYVVVVIGVYYTVQTTVHQIHLQYTVDTIIHLNSNAKHAAHT